MIKFSQNQFQNIEKARVQRSIRSIAEEIARIDPEYRNGGGSSGLHEKADRIAKFCSDYSILDTENMRRITRSHLRLGITVPEPHMSAPLKREGFLEDERVDAYLYALERKKKRIVLRLSA